MPWPWALAGALVWVGASASPAPTPIAEYVFAQSDCMLASFPDVQPAALLGPLACAGGCTCPEHVGVNVTSRADGQRALASVQKSGELNQRLRSSTRGFTVELWVRPSGRAGGDGRSGPGSIHSESFSLVALESVDGGQGGAGEAKGACGEDSVTFRLSQRDGELLVEVAAAYETGALAGVAEARGRHECYRVAARAPGHRLAAGEQGTDGGMESSMLLFDPGSLYHVTFVAPYGQQARLHITRARPCSGADERTTEQLTLWLVEYAIPAPFVIAPDFDAWPDDHQLTLGGRPAGLARPPPLPADAPRHPATADSFQLQAPQPLQPPSGDIDSAGDAAQVLYLAWYDEPLSPAQVGVRARTPLALSAPTVSDSEAAAAEDVPLLLNLAPFVHAQFDKTFFGDGNGDGTCAGEEGALSAGVRVLITSLPERGSLWDQAMDAGDAGDSEAISRDGAQPRPDELGGAAARRPLQPATPLFVQPAGSAPSAETTTTSAKGGPRALGVSDLPYLLPAGSATIRFLSAPDDNDELLQPSERGQRAATLAARRPYAQFRFSAVSPAGVHAAREGTVSVRVGPVNDAPLATDVLLDAKPHAPTAVRFDGSDVDDPPVALSAQLRSLPRHGVLRLRLAPSALAAADGVRTQRQADVASATVQPAHAAMLLADGAIVTQEDIAHERVPLLALGGVGQAAAGDGGDGSGGCFPRAAGGSSADDADGSGGSGSGAASGGTEALACVEYEFVPSAECTGESDGRALLCSDSFEFRLRDSSGAFSANMATVSVAVPNPLQAGAGETTLAEGGRAHFTLAAQAGISSGGRALIELVRVPVHGSVLLRSNGSAADRAQPVAAESALGGVRRVLGGGAAQRALRAGDQIEVGAQLEYVGAATYFNWPTVDPLGRPLAAEGEGDDGESIWYRVLVHGTSGTAAAGQGERSSVGGSGGGSLGREGGELRSAVGVHRFVLRNRPDHPTLQLARTPPNESAHAGSHVLRAHALSATAIPGLLLVAPDGDASLVRIRAQCTRGLLTLARTALSDLSVQFEVGDGVSDGVVQLVAVPSAAAALLAGTSYMAAAAGSDECSFEVAPTASASAGEASGSAAAGSSSVRVTMTILPPEGRGRMHTAGSNASEAHVRPLLALSVRGALCILLALCCFRLSRRCPAHAARASEEDWSSGGLPEKGAWRGRKASQSSERNACSSSRASSSSRSGSNELWSTRSSSRPCSSSTFATASNRGGSHPQKMDLEMGAQPCRASTQGRHPAQRGGLGAGESARADINERASSGLCEARLQAAASAHRAAYVRASTPSSAPSSQKARAAEAVIPSCEYALHMTPSARTKTAATRAQAAATSMACAEAGALQAQPIAAGKRSPTASSALPRSEQGTAAARQAQAPSSSARLPLNGPLVAVPRLPLREHVYSSCVQPRAQQPAPQQLPRHQASASARACSTGRRGDASSARPAERSCERAEERMHRRAMARANELAVSRGGHLCALPSNGVCGRPWIPPERGSSAGQSDRYSTFSTTDGDSARTDGSLVGVSGAAPGRPQPCAAQDGRRSSACRVWDTAQRESNPRTSIPRPRAGCLGTAARPAPSMPLS